MEIIVIVINIKNNITFRTTEPEGSYYKIPVHIVTFINVTPYKTQLMLKWYQQLSLSHKALVLG